MGLRWLRRNMVRAGHHPEWEKEKKSSGQRIRWTFQALKQLLSKERNLKQVELYTRQIVDKKGAFRVIRRVSAKH